MRSAAAGRRLHNVPAELTSFIGRRHELAEVKQRLGTSRLVTLTGPGGVGKTRLAIRAATEMVRAFPDGVWLTELAPIDDPLLVPQAVFHGLGLQDTSAGWSLSTLADYLSAKHLLLVLDNCEQLLDSCAVLVSGLLKSCPQLRVLATSRQALGADGEVRVRVPTLALPEGDTLPPAVLANFDAVALLVDRAAAVEPAFRLDDSTAAAVLRLCRRLDGIPLALELAAARLESLDIDQLNDLLDPDLLVLEGRRGGEARQQTLKATIAWSHRLLTEQERLLWARLSVFAGSFDQQAAVEVCSGPQLPAAQLASVLAALVEKSIVRREASVFPSRYVLLETLRQFGRQRLGDLGDQEVDALIRHRDWVGRLAASAADWGAGQADAFNHLDLERSNLWAALDFCSRQPGQAAQGIDICCDLYAYWNSRGPLADARRVIASLLSGVESDDISRGRGSWLAAGLVVWQGDFESARAAAEESLRIGKLHGDAAVTAAALGHLGVLAWAERRLGEALPLLESAIEIAASNGDQARVYWAKSVVCAVHLASGDLARATVAGEEVVATGEAWGELWARGIVLGFLGEARFRLGDWEGGTAALREGVACKTALGDRTGLASRLEAMAWMLAERGAAKEATALLGCAAGTRESIGPIFPAFAARHEKLVSSVRAQLGEAAYAAAFQQGRAMTVEDAIGYALDRKKPSARPAVPRGPAGAEARSAVALTRREREIAALVGEGLSNKEIAAKLVVSERTAETHVWNIFNKLGINSRSQLASWAATHHLTSPAPSS